MIGVRVLGPASLSAHASLYAIMKRTARMALRWLLLAVLLVCAFGATLTVTAPVARTGGERAADTGIAPDDKAKEDRAVSPSSEDPLALIRDYARSQGRGVSAYDIASHFSGTTITYGAENVFNAAATLEISVAALDATHFVAGYRYFGNGSKGRHRARFPDA